MLESRVLLASVPAPFTSADVGAVGSAGSASFAAGTFTVTGSGVDAFGPHDSFQYVYAPLNGDGAIFARVTGQSGPGGSAAGLMIRSSLQDNAADGYLALRSDNQVFFNSRTSDGGSGANVNIAGAQTPFFLELQRSGNTVTGLASTDGVTYNTIASVTVNLPTNALVGLVVASGNTAASNTATFDNLSGPGFNFTSPTASLTAAPLTIATSNPYQFNVTYASVSPINASTLGNGNIIVTGPNSYTEPATLVSTGLSNANTLTATYSVPPPPSSGVWDANANGDYTVTMQANQVANISGLQVIGAALGTFNVNVAPDVHGTVYNVQNLHGVGGQTLFLDNNQNGILDPGEPTTVSDAQGHYIFPNLSPGTYRVIEKPSPAFNLDLPTAGFIDVSVNAGQSSTPANFGDTPAPLPANTAGPDLIGTLLTTLPKKGVVGGTPGKVAIRIDNAGAVAAKGVIDVSLFASTDMLPTPDDIFITTIPGVKLNIAAGGTTVVHVRFNWPVSAPALPNGNYFLLMSIDSNNALAETNEVNNVFASKAPVYISAPFVDLTGFFGQTPAVLRPGQQAGINLKVENLGDVTAVGAMSITLFASIDGTDTNEIPLTTFSVQTTNIKPGGVVKKYSLPLLTPSGVPHGRYFLIAHIDALHQILDSDLTNNTAVSVTQTLFL